jgi:hypothetical protein
MPIEPYVRRSESCRRRGIDPHAYLTDVLERIPDAKTSDIKNLTPEAWARSRPRLAAAAYESRAAQIPRQSAEIR